MSARRTRAACVARLALTLLALALVGRLGHAQERVVFPSLDPPSGPPVMLVAHWFAAPGASAAPAGAVVLLHGCGGAYDKRGALDPRMRDYTVWFHERGWSVLIVDSLGPRGEKETCTQRVGARRVTPTNRRRDALAAIDWLSERPEVNARRIGLVGWSSGGSTVLAATNVRHPDVDASVARPAFAVAFYPGCESERARGYEPDAPLLVLIGEADDWTPARPCRQLAEQGGPDVDLEAYAGAYHGFDSTLPVRLRRDVPGGVHPGKGVHAGGQPEALARSRERLAGFLARF
jgi:dienelactone hydrolase